LNEKTTLSIILVFILLVYCKKNDAEFKPGCKKSRYDNYVDELVLG